MNVTRLAPEPGPVPLTELLSSLTVQACRASPFAPERIDFCDALARALFARQDAAAFPEVQSLAFWLRKGSITGFSRGFDELKVRGTLRVPRGLVFHVTPGNVDTMFVYSWVLSLLCGNVNLLRISQRPSPVTDLLVSVLNEVFGAGHETIRRSTAIVTYGHDAAITAQISGHCDARVIWGGDQAVEAIRSAVIRPGGMDLTFGDRRSFCVIRASRLLEADPQGVLSFATDFFNDAYWFDQAACSSPHAIYWIGSREECQAAAERFVRELTEVIHTKGHSNATGAALEVMAHAFAAASSPASTTVLRGGNELTAIDYGDDSSPEAAGDHRCGHGFFTFHSLARLEDLASRITRHDQTMTYFGLDPEELQGFGRLVNGQGVDRIVPVGNALKFDRFWDGYDLLHELTKQVVVPATAVRGIPRFIGEIENP